MTPATLTGLSPDDIIGLMITVAGLVVFIAVRSAWERKR